MRLKQILLNLLSNACKFTKEGEVALRVRKVADGRDWVELAVADTGIGLTAEQQANAKSRRAIGFLNPSALIPHWG
jgi:signal transduction histidine kinase